MTALHWKMGTEKISMLKDVCLGQRIRQGEDRVPVV